MKAIFIRHGFAESNRNTPNRTVGEHAALTPEGMQQIRAIAPLVGKLATTKTIFTSPYPRTVQSAEILADALGLAVIVDDRLQEHYKGAWQGRPVKEVMELEAQIDIDERPFHRAPGGGENWLDVGMRMAAFVEELRQAGKQEAIIMSHNHPIRMGIGKLLNQPVANWEEMPLENASITILRHHGNRWRLGAELTDTIY